MKQHQNMIKGLALVTMAIAMPSQAERLEDCIQQVLSQDPEILQSEYRLYESQGGLSISTGEFLPSLTLSGDIGAERTKYLKDVEIDRELTRETLSLALTQPLFRGFSNYYQYKSAKADVSAREHELNYHRESKAFEMTEVYLSVMLSKKLLELAEANLADHERIRKDIHTKVSNQLSAPADLAQVDSRLANARASTIAAKNRYRDNLNRYYSLMGGFPEGELELPVPIASDLPENLEEAIDRARAGHEQILSAKSTVASSKASLKAQKGSYYPNVDIKLVSNYANDISGIEGKDQDLAAMLTVEYELFSGLKDYNRVKQSRHRYQQQVQQQLDIERSIRLNVETTWNATNYLAEQLEYLKDNVDASIRAEEGYEAQFRVGRRDLLDVLISKTETFRAEQAYTDVLYRQMIADYELRYSMGELISSLKNDDDTTSTE